MGSAKDIPGHILMTLQQMNGVIAEIYTKVAGEGEISF